jgi:hypothetical protein
LRPILDGRGPDAARIGPEADIDDLNARDIDERRGRSIGELITEIEADGALHDELLSRLTDAHADVPLSPYAVGLAEFLTAKAAGNRGAHDLRHLAQLRSALQASR